MYLDLNTRIERFILLLILSVFMYDVIDTCNLHAFMVYPYTYVVIWLFYV